MAGASGSPDRPQDVGTGVRTVAELLAARARQQPDELAYTFLADGDADERPLTYRQTDLRARTVAARIREAGARPGDRVVLLLPPGLDYVTAFFGCLHAGVIAVPVYPPDPAQLERTIPRLLAVVSDARPLLALTTTPLLGWVGVLGERAPALRTVRWVAADGAPDADAADCEPGTAAADATAMLQYTSGSTSSPRGVVLSHAHLLHNSGLIRALFRTSPSSRGMVWLPPYHDMGLIGGLIQPLYAGFPVTLMSPLHFLEQPLRWLRAVSRLGVTVSGGPNFAYDLCARKASPEQVAELDLSSWEVAFDGAEPVRRATLRRFAEVFAPAGFRPEAFLPCYGLAEATLIVSGAGGVAGAGCATGARRTVRTVPVAREALERHLIRPADGPDAVPLVSCGPPAPGQQVVVVDPATATACPEGRVGEIWVSGPSVAGGYWGRPEETERTFGARIAGDGSGGAFLRTGDLGFLVDGEVVVTGRLKDLLVVRGQNHYPQDVELTAERADPRLRPGCSAAFLVDPARADGSGGGDRLVLVHEVRGGDVDVDEVSARVREAVARVHGLQVHAVALLRAGAVPKTSSGKVQRSRCRDLFVAGELPVLGCSEPAVEPDLPPAGPGDSGQDGDRIERYLRARVAEATGLAAAALDRERPLLATGLDSLAVLQLGHRVKSELSLRLPLAHVLAGATLAEVAAELRDQVPGTGPEAATAGVASDAGPAGELDAPLSPGQRWMWFLQQLEPDDHTNVVSVALRLPDGVDVEALTGALGTVVARHPGLRTTFPVRGGEPVQVVRQQAAPDVRVQEHDAREDGADDLAVRLATDARRPFDLAQGPLLRVGLYRHPRGDVLLVSAHHIVTDFWSMTVLARELGAAYTALTQGRAPALPPLRASHLDVAARRRGLARGEGDAGRLARYWDEQVGSGVPPLALPPPTVPGEDGARTFALAPSLTARLVARATAESVTLNVLLLAAFQAVLHRRTGQPDLVVGMCVAARTRPEDADVVGCCMNPVLVRSRWADGEPFRSLLRRAQQQVIGALENQEYPMTLLAQRHADGRRRTGLFEALFTFNRSPERGEDLAALATVAPSGVRRRLGTLSVETVALPPPPSSQPVDLVMAEVDGALHGLLRHRGDVLDAAGAEQLVVELTGLLEAVAVDAGTPVHELVRD